MGREFLVLAVLAAAAPALADEGPLILPNRDVVVEYRTLNGMVRWDRPPSPDHRDGALRRR